MINDKIEMKAKLYVYDLNNCAVENGFKPDEAWEFSMATDEEKTAIEKKYFPTISAKVMPEFLSEMFHLVKSKLVNAKYNKEHSAAHNPAGSSLQYLIAYNPGRLRH
jgi:hypothetical protein